MNLVGGWKDGSEGGMEGMRRGWKGDGWESYRELNVDSSGLLGAQAEDKVLFFKFALRVAVTLEKAGDGHVGMGVEVGVEMGADWEVSKGEALGARELEDSKEVEGVVCVPDVSGECLDQGGENEVE
eukprot:g33199.t1